MVSVLSALNDYLNIKCYVEVKGKRYGNHPLQKFILEERKEPKSLGTQSQVMNDIKKGTNQKLINNGSDELEIRQYPKNKIKQKIGKPKLDVEYHICKQRNWIELDEGHFSPICELNIIKRKYQIDQKAYRQDKLFSTELPNANKKTTEKYCSSMNTKYKTIERMITKLQNSEGEIAWKIARLNYMITYDEVFLFSLKKKHSVKILEA